MSVASWLPVCGPECFSLFFEEDPDPDPSQSRQTSTYQQVKRQVQSQGKDNEGQNSQNQSPTQREARVLAASWDLSGRHAWMPLLTCLVLIALLAAVVGFNHGRAAPEHVAPVVTPDCSQDFSGDVRALAFCCHHFSKHCDDLDHPASSAIGAGIMIGIDPMEDTLDAISARFPPNMAGPEAVPGAKLAGLQNQAGPYDCQASLSMWRDTWSEGKKDWCCLHEGEGCNSFDCTGKVDSMHANQRKWCCSHFQKGCAPQASEGRGCSALCHGTTSTCREKFHWTVRNVFPHQEDACTLAYSKVQLECDACWECSVEDMGCEEHAPLAMSDCSTDSDDPNGWSSPKREFCCREHGIGCSPEEPPAPDAGLGKSWARAKVGGRWRWVAQSADYDCWAALQNAAAAWSAHKQEYCCRAHGLGC